MGWGTFLKASIKYGGEALKATANSAGKAVIHPATTLRNLGNASKTAVIGGGAAYVGWEKLTTDKSVVGIVSDAVIGEGATESIGKTVDGVVDEVKELKDTVGGLSNNVSSAISSVDSKWNGMSNLLQGIFSGNGGEMFGNFFKNLGSGNVSGLSIAGLVVSALLVFGRFGWLGKIAGAVLGMMMIGNNARSNQIRNAIEQKEQMGDNIEKTQSNSVGLRR